MTSNGAQNPPVLTWRRMNYAVSDSTLPSFKCYGATIGDLILRERANSKCWSKRSTPSFALRARDYFTIIGKILQRKVRRPLRPGRGAEGVGKEER